jgi:hypothetical protein
MKTLTHVVLPIAIAVAVVGVVAYVTQNTSRPPAANNSSTAPETSGPAVGNMIVFDEILDENPKPLVVEPLSKNHQDIWFHNPQSQPVLICTKKKSCTCSELEVGSVGLSDAEWEAVQKYPSLVGWCKLAASVNFAPLPEKDKGDERTTIPAQRPQVLRINWKSKTDTVQDAIEVTLQAEAPNGTVNFYPRRVVFSILPTVGHFPLLMDAGDLVSGDRRTVDFFVWSETRDRLQFKARVLTLGENAQDEPCVEVSEPVEIPVKQAIEQLKAANELLATLRLRCAYQLTLTVHERRGDKQFDMGPFLRRINLEFETEPKEEPVNKVQFQLIGLVKGEVRLLNGDDKERISLGAYKYDQGRSNVIARLGAIDSNVDLELVSTANPKLHAKLLEPKIEGGRRHWDLKVDMEPYALLGELPSSTVITLRTKGPNARILRIPVSGRAER